MPKVVGFKKIEAVFRKSVGIDLDKSKADEIIDIVEKKFHDLLLVAVEKAGYNGRDIIMEQDMPITRGFEESLREFKKIEAVFKKAAGLELDKSKADRIIDIVEKKFHDLLLVAVEKAGYNGRDIIQEADMPITKGFEESLRQFRELEEAVDIQDVLQFLEQIPPLKYPIAKELEEKLPEYIGALMLIIARVLKELGVQRKPSKEDIERTSKILDLTL